MSWDQVLAAIAILTPDKTDQDELRRVADIALTKGQAVTVSQGQRSDLKLHDKIMKFASPKTQGDVLP